MIVGKTASLFAAAGAGVIPAMAERGNGSVVIISSIGGLRGSPVLGAGYESSVPGLHFVGSSAVKSYGSLLRFVWGAGYAARNVTSFVCANRSKGASAWPCAEKALAHPTETASNLS